MFGILAAVGILGVVGILALLTWLNEKAMRRALAPYLSANKAPVAELPKIPLAFYGGAVGAVARPTGHPAAMRQYRSETTALAPVQWHDNGELLPALPATVRIPAQPETPEPAYSETRTPQRAPSIEADVTVPILQAAATAAAVGIMAGLVAWALGWSWKVPVVATAIVLAGTWLWRLGVADSLLWQVESFTGRDLDNDQHVGRPQMSFTLANPATARQTVAQEVRAAAASAEQAALLQFLDACYMRGTAEAAHGVTAAGPDRTAYLVKRAALMGLGIAQWKHPERPKAGWRLAVSRQRARQLVQKHVL